MAPSVAATEAVSGHGGGLDKQAKVPAKVSSADDEMLVLNTIRCLAADLCQQVCPPGLVPTGRCTVKLMSSTRVVTPVPSWVLLLLESLCGDITCNTTQRIRNGSVVIVSLISPESEVT